MFGTPKNRMFESPENKAKMPLTENTVRGISETVKPEHQIIYSNNIPPRARADLPDGNVGKACSGPHTSALALGCFSAHAAREANTV